MDWLMGLIASGYTVKVRLHGSIPVVERSLIEVCALGIVVADSMKRREFYPCHCVRGIVELEESEEGETPDILKPRPYRRVYMS